MAVIVREAFGDPEPARGEWSREVPWAKLKRAQSLDVPDVKEFVRDGAECSFVNTWLTKRAGLDDLSRSEMLHAVAGMIVGSEVDHKRVLFKLRRSPHGDFGPHDLLDVFHERGAAAAFWSKRVDHDVILFAVYCEVVQSPVRCDFSGCVDHDVPV